MRRSPIHVLHLALSSLLALAACSCFGGAERTDSRDTGRSESLPPPADQRARVPQAEAQLAAFLERALETSPKQDFESLMACIPDGQTDRYVALAHYRVLGSTQRQDTVDATAEVVTVAEEVSDPHSASGYVTTVRIRRDTLHWVMTRHANDKWGVCGYPREGIGFGHYGTDRTTRWIPPGFSWARVRQLADSVARHEPK
jgi:hypothetical protein